MPRGVVFALPFLLTASPATAAAVPVPVLPPPPACFVLNWKDGDFCLFSAPAGAFAFGGVATPPGDNYPAEIAVQIRLQGTFQPLASCYDRQPDMPASCHEYYDAPIDGLVTYVCQAFGSGGPKFHCADPPRLPLVTGV